MKEIHVNAYTKSDGTHVKEHYRTIDSDGYTITPQGQRQNFNSVPVLTGGVSMDVDAGDILQGGVSTGGIDWGNIGSAIGQTVLKAADAAIKAAPIALQMYQAVKSSNDSAIQYLKPQFNNSIKSLEETQKVMKQNIDNNLNKLSSAKNQEEYANLYKSFTKENETYKKTSDSITRIKHAASNNDYETVVSELDNYKNLQKNVISDSFMNNQVDFSKMQASKNTQQYKPDLSGMNYAPIPSPYMNANTQPDWWSDFANSISKEVKNLNLNPGSFLESYPNLQKLGIDMAMSYFGNLENDYDAKELWKAASHDFKYSNNYINKNGTIVNSVNELPERLRAIVSEKLQGQFGIKDKLGVIFKPESTLSQAIAKSPELREHILKNIDKLKRGETIIKESACLDSNKNLEYALKHADILYTQMDTQGNITALVLDTYDFNAGDEDWRVQIARNVQENGLLSQYYTINIIVIPWQEWLNWLN